MSEHTRYINPLVDFSFRKIFGSDPNKDLLIAFLNEIFKGRKHIVDLVYNKNEHDGDNQEEARAVFDLLCTGDQGERFIIEVQHTKPVNFKKRGIYYTSRLISEQAVKGQINIWQYDITEVYFVAVLETSSDLSTGNDRYIHDACLCYRETGEIFYEGLGYTYLDLPNFVKTEEECVSELDRWLYWLKHLHETDELPEYLRATIFERLFNIAEYTKLSKEEQAMYNQDLKRKWDNEAARVNSIEEGKAKGRYEQALEIAAEMKRKNFPDETIAELTKLKIEEIKSL
ncbi:MAG: Rpn family recombination-promoting nuclease/putative transposase [Bacteroidota bacterium]